MQKMNCKKLYLLILLPILFLNLQAQNFKVATYNVRLYNKSDEGNLWEERKAALTSLIRYHDWDVFGTQEGFAHQLNDITDILPEYNRYGKGRDDGKEKGEHSAVYFKKDKFQLLDSGDFWLSETPEKPGLGWDATCCNRICSWVFLKDKKSKKQFYFFSVHYDHQGKIARRESSKLMLAKIKEIAKNMPVILVGDFNADRDSEPYKILATSTSIRDSYNEVTHPYENNTSFNNFGKSVAGNNVIDHIFITRQWKASKWGILTDTYHGKYPSDHFPVEAVLEIIKKK